MQNKHAVENRFFDKCSKYHLTEMNSAAQIPTVLSYLTRYYPVDFEAFMKQEKDFCTKSGELSKEICLIVQMQFGY